MKELKGHTAAVRAVAYSPDGARIASASEDKTIRIWNPATGESPQELKGHTGMVWALAFSPRGRTLASAGFDNSLRLWSGQSGSPLQTLTGHQDVVTSLSYAPDSSGIVTGSYDKTLKLWPAIEPPIPALADLNLADNGEASLVRFVVFNPEGTRMITGTQNQSLRLWDLNLGRVMKTAVHPRGISDGALAPDGKLLVTVDFGGKLYFWNTETLELIDTLETGQSQGTAMAFSPDGKLLATGDWDGNAKIWNVLTRKKIGELPKQELPVTGIAFSPDGKLAATTTGNYKESNKAGTVKLWNTETWNEIANLPGPTKKMRPVAFSPDGRTLIAGGTQNELLVYDVPNKKLAARVPMGTEIDALAFLPDSRTAVVGRYDGKVELWNVQSRQRLANYEGHSRSADPKRRYVYDVGVSPDGSVVASASADGHVKLWPTSDLPPIPALVEFSIEKAEPFSVAVSPDGSRLAVATTAKTIEIRETKTGNVLKTIGPFKSSCASVSFSPDGQWIAGAAQSGWATVWNAETGEKLFSVEAHPGGARRANFSPDGGMLATCGWDETAAVWNLPDGSLRYRIDQQGLALSDVKFTPEGKLLITSTGSHHEWQKPGTVKCWMAEDGKFVRTLGSHDAEIKGLLFDAGGWHIISYGVNGIKIWSRFDSKLHHAIAAGTTITAASVSPDGNTLYAGERSGRTTVYDLETGKIKRTFEGHEELVDDISASADGTLIASSSKDGSVKIWPGERMPVLTREFQLHDDPVESLSVAYSPDGSLIAVGGKDKTISLIDAKTKTVKKELSGHNGMVFRMVFAPDGKSLLSGSSDGTVRLWDVETGRKIASWTAHAEKISMVRSVAISPDGERIAAGNWDGETRVWDVKTRELVFELPKQSLPISGLAFSPDGEILAGCTGSWQNANAAGIVFLWSPAAGLAKLEGHSQCINGVLFTADGKTLISWGNAKTIRFWDVDKKSLVRTYVHDRTITAAAVSGDQLAFGDFRGGVCLMDLKRGVVTQRTGGHFNLIGNMAFSPDGSEIATASHDSYFKLWSAKMPELAIRQMPVPEAGERNQLAETIRGWQSLTLGGATSLEMRKLKSLSPHGEQVWFAIYSPDGKTLATGGTDKTVKLWNAETMELIHTLSGHRAFTTRAAFSPDGKKVATVSWDADKTVKLWDVETGKLLASAQAHESGCRDVAFSPDGQFIATACEDHHVRLFTPDLALSQSIDVGLNVYSLAFSPDSKILAVGTGNWRDNKPGHITLYNPEDGKKIKEFADSEGYVFDLQFLKDGKHLLAGNARVGCAIWNVETGKIEESYRPDQDTRWVEISRDETRIIACAKPGLVQIWDRNESQPIASFKASEKFVHCATFAPDGKHVLVADEAGALSVWEMKPSAQTQVAKIPDSTQP